MVRAVAATASAAGSRPGAHDPVLTGGDDAVLAEYERREPLLRDLLADERLQHGHFVEARAGRRSHESEPVRPT